MYRAHTSKLKQNPTYHFIASHHKTEKIGSRTVQNNIPVYLVMASHGKHGKTEMEI